MKKLLFLSLILLSFSVFAEDSTLKVIEDTSQVTFSKVYNDVKVGINAVASALKVGAEHVYEVLVRQQVVNAIIYCILFLIGIIGLIISFKALIKLGWSDNSYYSNEWVNKGGYEEWKKTQANASNVIFVISGLISLIVFFIGIINLDVIVSGIINPEYGALQEIMSWIK